MSLTLIIYLLIYISLTFLALVKKPVWGVSLYIFNLLIFPRLWWWGKHLPIERWSLLSGCILIAGVFLYYCRNWQTSPSTSPALVSDAYDIQIRNRLFNTGLINKIFFFMIVNYSVVHYIIASGSPINAQIFFLSLKFILLFYLVNASIRHSDDFFIIFMTIVLCIGYMGFQFWLGNAGSFRGGRLEYIPIPSARSPNIFASILVLFLPSMGALFFVIKKKIFKIVILFCFPFILNTLFLLNSRGAYLGIIASGITLFFLSRKKERKIILIAAICVFIAVPFLAKDEKIYNRFTSIFTKDENRDYSAQSRFLFWQAAIDMISDHPLGLGGNAFKSNGLFYLRHYNVDKHRAVHNGYLNIATQWGLQGIFLYIFLIFIIFRKTLMASKFRLWKFENLYHETFFIKACLSGIVGFSISSVFSNTLDEEWVFWMLAILSAYINLVRTTSHKKAIIDF